jgi:hypothetical protein
MPLRVFITIEFAALLAAAGCASHPAKEPERASERSAANLSPTTTSGGTNFIGHPLRHPEFKMVTAPKRTWNVHWMYPNEVMSYLLKSPRDSAEAKRVLAEYGLGRGDKPYLFVARAGTPIVVNGTEFQTRKEAVAFVKKRKLTRLLYVPENTAFPTQIPVWLDEEGIDVWVLKWQQ